MNRSSQHGTVEFDELVLVVEDDATMRATCERILERAGYVVAAVANATEALLWLEDHPGGCILLTDLRMPGMDGLELLDSVRENHRNVDVVVMTAYGSIDNAVDAMRRGAADYVTKPFNKDELLMCVARVAEVRGLHARIAELEGGLQNRFGFDGLVATSPAMAEVLARMRSASQSTANVLLSGESGTGKDIVARIIHYSGPRAAGPFVPVNCAGLPADLIESELFGHGRGAYTGAVSARPGLVRKAHGGTLLLDEITEMPASTQAKLLRVLQDKRVRAVGETEERQVDVRIIAATNRHLERVLAEGQLRQDLYYRLSVLDIHLPPLRERPEDIVPLVRHFIDQVNRDRAEDEILTGVDPDAVELLRRHSWPGNVRELGSLIERCAAMGTRGSVSRQDIERELAPHHPVPSSKPTASASSSDEADLGVAPASSGEATSLEEVEREAIIAALAQTNNNKAAAARILGIARKTLYEKIRRHELDADGS